MRDERSNAESVTVVAVDKDPMVRRLISQSLANTEFDARVSEGVDEALALLQGADAPAVVVQPWSTEATDRGPASQLRRTRAGRAQYTIVTLGPGEAAALVDAVEAGADDVLIKPFSAESLLSRLRLAARRRASGAQFLASPREALREALESGRGGEVVVRQGDQVGRVHVIDGGVAWATASGGPARVQDIVRHAGVTLDDEVVRALLEECRRTGQHFAEVLVEWSLLDATDARECVRAFIAEQLATMFSWAEAAALFLPSSRSYGAGLRFAWSEVVGATLVPRAPASVGVNEAPPMSLAWLGQATLLVEEIAKIEGVVGAIALDAHSGTAVVSAGDGVDADVAWSLLSALRALGEGGQEVLATRPEAAYVARAIAGGGALIARVDLTRTTVGMARLSIQRCAEARSGGAAPQDR